ncbi:MAG: PAS domain-containing sensor histidine kinase [Ardenticatenaceae bacterium]|nr:PAS domain-containing sensor histidine kinase [Ardenticatenaceae bacterium]MCB9443230.1 PAS domain-containing sensor histidine kinase [Ardenticatenaceae bacterium]
MFFTTPDINPLILLLGTAVFTAILWWYQRQQHAAPETKPLVVQNGRSYHHQTSFGSPGYLMAPATRDAVVNSMNDGMIVLDVHNRIIDMNPSARRITHKSLVDLVGKDIEQALPALSRHINEAMTKPLDIALGYKDANRFYELSISPFFDGVEERRGNLLILRDITERKQRENLRDDLTRTMVHDLRDPISNSLFALEMLKTTLAENLVSETQQLLDLTFASTAKTLQLVDKILEIGRLESGELPLALTAFPLHEMVEHVLTAQMPRAVNKHLQLINEVSDSLPLVWADAELIERVLKNLVDNSIKFTPVGGVIRVTAVTTTNEQTNETGLLVSVIDNGPGIPTAVQPQIFEQFVTGNQIESGSGLGLAFCKMALAAHGQTIGLNSQQGQGTTFTFSLAVSPGEA